MPLPGYSCTKASKRHFVNFQMSLSHVLSSDFLVGFETAETRSPSETSVRSEGRNAQAKPQAKA
jgi:hypothetical protein